MARAGNLYENAMIEISFKTLKYEEVYLCEYGTFEDVLERPSYFIDEVYNSEEASFGSGLSPTEMNYPPQLAGGASDSFSNMRNCKESSSWV